MVMVLLFRLRAVWDARSTRAESMFGEMLDSLLGEGSWNEDVPKDPSRDREQVLEILFGRAAPSANKVIGFLGTQRGQQVLGVASVAIAAGLIPKVVGR